MVGYLRAINEIDMASRGEIDSVKQANLNAVSFPKVYKKQHDAYVKEKEAKLAKKRRGKTVVKRTVTVKKGDKQGLAAALTKAQGASDG